MESYAKGYAIAASDRVRTIDYMRMREYRIKRTQQLMKEKGIGLLVTWDGLNVRYLSGLYLTLPTRWAESQCLILPVNGEPEVYCQSDPEYREEMPWAAEHIHHPIGGGRMADRVEDWNGVMDTIEELVGQYHLQGMPVGLDGTSCELIISKAAEARGIQVVDAQSILFEARMVKCPEEVECVRMACTLSEAAFDAVKNSIRPGVRECELVGAGMERLYSLGADETMEFVCATGPRTNPLHIDFTDRMVRPGDFVIVDTNGCSWQGYKACYYRTFKCGKAKQEEKDWYKFTRDMTYLAMDKIKAGVSALEIANAWPKAPTQWGYDSWMSAHPGMALAHGIGLSLHEKPMVSPVTPKDADVPILQEGMVLAIEVWAGPKGGKYGIRLEEQVAVTKDGYDLLSMYPVDELTEVY